MKAIVYNKLIVDLTLIENVFHRTENILGTGENAGYQHFLLFTECFLLIQKGFSVFKLHLFCSPQMLSIWTSLKICHLVESRFVWANGGAARIGKAIPVCSIGCLPILETLPSLPLDIWQIQQRFRNKMAEAGN